MTGVEVLIVAEKLLPALTKIGKNIGNFFLENATPLAGCFRCFSLERPSNHL